MSATAVNTDLTTLGFDEEFLSQLVEQRVADRLPSTFLNPQEITDYSRGLYQLEWFWIFSLFVAGKKSETALAACDRFCCELERMNCRFRLDVIPSHPLSIINQINDEDLESALRKSRSGQYGRLVKALRQSAGFFLWSMTLEAIEKISGCGPKTARFFLLHSDPNIRCMPLDRHILKWMSSVLKIPGVPVDTPSSPKAYAKWEQTALALVDWIFPAKTIAEADLLIWMMMRGDA
jgi:hypothetical protein